MKDFFKKYISEIIVFGCILIVLWGYFWWKGTLLLLDYVLTAFPNMQLVHPITTLTLDTLAYIFGTECISRIFFIGILIAAWYLGILFSRYFSRYCNFAYPKIIEIFGGIFFVLNPFAYERMMVQPTIYAGIIALGYCIYFLLQRSYLYSGVAAGIAFALFPHASFMIFLIYALWIGIFIHWKKDIIRIGLALGIVVLINANWLLAPLFWVANSTASISSFNAANYEAFITQSLAPMNVWFTNLFLYGFWGERFGNHFASVWFLSSLWFIAGFLIIAVMGYGIYTFVITADPDKGQKQWRKNTAIFLAILAIAALIFGIGVASPMLRGLTLFMAEHIPLWQGYREPQKWIGILMIVEGISFILWVWYLLKLYGSDTVVRISIVFSLLLLLITWSPGSLFGYQGQLRLSQYPEDFSILREKLVGSNASKTVALPWHSYLGCSWTGRPTIANPIKGLLYPAPIISADNIEVSGILYSNSTDPVTRGIEEFIRTKDIWYLKASGITNFLLMKQCADSDNYTWVNTLKSCQKDYSSKYVDFYTCK